MSDGRRPGGLTALAVLNFMFGAWSSLGVVTYLGLMHSRGRDDFERDTWLSLRADDGLIWLHFMLTIASAALLLVSGAGYLGQKRFMGRTVGNAYGVVALVGTALVLTHGRFDVGTLIGLVYPVLTLVLINTTFRHDLVAETAPPSQVASRESALTGLHGNHVVIVARYAMRFAIRTGAGLATLLAVLIVGLTVASTFVGPVEDMLEGRTWFGHEHDETASDVERVADSWRVSGALRGTSRRSDLDADYLLRDNPALLSAIFFCLLFVVPFLACVSASNQTSGDIGNRSLRYLLLRTERPNIFFGRFLGSLAFLGASLAALFVLLVVYVALRLDLYPLGAMAWWSLQACGAALALGLAYTALSAWISSAVDSPGASLVLCLLATGFPIVFVNMAADAMDAKADPWQRVLPWGWKHDLLSHDVGTRLLAYGVLLGFTLVFLFLGARAFRRRDL